MSDQAQVELASLRLGLNTELASENFYACFVLPQRRGPTVSVYIELHQRAMRGLVERLECQQAKGDLHTALRTLASHVMRKELSKCLDGSRPDPLTLKLQPLFERPLVHAEALEEIAVVQTNGLLERLARITREAALKPDDVDNKPVCIQANAIAVGQQHFDVQSRKRVAKVQ